MNCDQDRLLATLIDIKKVVSEARGQHSVQGHHCELRQAVDSIYDRADAVLKDVFSQQGGSVFQRIENVVKEINDVSLRNTAQTVLSNADFFYFPASTHVHHAYVGGLATHTLEVMEYALKYRHQFPEANFDIILTAAIWHDYAKIWDYELRVFPNAELPKRYVRVEEAGGFSKVYVANYKYKDTIHHISGSTAEFTAAAISSGVQRGLIMAVQHAILAHHGRKEWGTVKDPQTLEAWILHSADYSSAHFGPRKNK